MFMTARRVAAIVCVALAALAASLSTTTPALAQFPLFASQPRYAAVVVDAQTGEVLYAKNADSARYPASISKVMTLYLVFEALQSGKLSLNDTITVSSHAASMAPTKLGLAPGDTITVDQAIRAAAVKSANDMAVALAEKVGGTEPRFAALMTLRAQELGMRNSHFANASGLPDSRQISTARDIAILSRAVMRDFPQYYSYFGLRSFEFHGQLINNHNHLLDSMPGVDGLKTGFTGASGYNLAASAVRNGHRLIAVVMGGPSWSARDAHVEDLLATGFDIMRRRDNGETIQVAQNLFEPAPRGPLEGYGVAQGDSEQPADSLHVVVTDRDLVPPVPISRTLRAETPRRPPVERPARTERASSTEMAEIAVCVSSEGRGRHARRVEHEVLADGHCRRGQKLETRMVHDNPRREASARDRRRGGDWLVQVGAFSSRAKAHKVVAEISRKFSRQLGDAEGSVDTARAGLFRARFTGLSASAARDACSAIEAQGQACTAMKL